MATTIETTNRGRLIGLDVLRGLAVLLVLVHHLPAIALPAQWPDFLQKGLDACRDGGWIGVDLFFVLSGFLVSGLLFGEYRSHGSISAGRFYVRRGWKIYPPFIALILVTVTVHLAVYGSVNTKGLLAECLFVQSYVPGLWNHTWSLAVEEHFYLALPILLMLILWARGRCANPFAGVLPIAIIICCVVVLMLRLDNFAQRPGYHHLTHLAQTHLRIDALFWGVLISYAFHFHRERFVRLFEPHRRPLIALGVMLLSAPFIWSRHDHGWIITVGPTLYYLGGGALVIGCVLSPMRDRGVTGAIARIGVYSYSIYLWHMPVFRWGAPKIEKVLDRSLSAPAQLVLPIVASLVVGVLMAWAIEVPALAFRDRWFPGSRSNPNPPTPTPAPAAPSIIEQISATPTGHA